MVFCQYCLVIQCYTASVMNIKDWLQPNTTELEKAGIGTARLDCLVLLEDVTGKNRAWLLAHPEFELTGTQLKTLESQIQKRTQHIPLAQIRGKTEFYGREFVINEHVLEPRPESETMIDLLKNLASSGKVTTGLQLLDVGCGSGALGITAKLELPALSVTLSDIDEECLKITRKNVANTSIDTSILKSDLLESVPQTDIILANLPYVPDDYAINEAALNEPRIAIFGGQDGLDLYGRLFLQIATLSQKPKYILTESLPFQHTSLAKIAQKTDYRLVQEADFIQVFEKQ